MTSLNTILRVQGLLQLVHLYVMIYWPVASVAIRCADHALQVMAIVANLLKAHWLFIYTTQMVPSHDQFVFFFLDKSFINFYQLVAVVTEYDFLPSKSYTAGERYRSCSSQS